MTAYRNAWTLTVTVLCAIAFAMAVRITGWVAPVVVLLSMSAVGALFGVVLYDDDPEARKRIMGRLALWLGLGSVLLVGFTPVIGQWVALLVLALGGLAPDVLARCLAFSSAHGRTAAVRGLEDLSYDELERRWRTTTGRLRSRSLPVQELVDLVAQRGRLLEELERRDPARFEMSLARAGWRESQRDHPGG